jgi:alpha-L-fucosidase 2
MSRSDIFKSAEGGGAAAVSRDQSDAPGILSWPDIGTDWTDGLPLSNGWLGAMAWARNNSVVVSLDRTDVWDLRPVPEFEEVGFTYANLTRLREIGDKDEINRLFEKPFHTPGRGKIPLGRIDLGIVAEDVCGSKLNLQDGLGEVTLHDGTVLTFLVAATAQFGIIQVEGASASKIAKAAKIEPPHFDFAPPSSPPQPRGGLDYGGAEDLNYGKSLDLTQDNVSGYASGLDSQAFAAVARVLDQELNRVTIIWTIASEKTRQQAADVAQALLARQTQETLEHAIEEHSNWWGDFWQKASVSAPSRALDKRWKISTYHLGAAARLHGPPVPLQSPWTWDNGRLPAWKGDYHHDLNTQMTYWPAYTGNRPDISHNFVDWLWQTKPECEHFAKHFFNAPGLAVPSTVDILNRPLGGWAAHSYSPTVGAWLLHHFDLHWRYFGNDEYLKTRAYPCALDVVTFLEAQLRPRAGKPGLFLPAFTSPEINDNTLASWFSEWTNFDLALVRYAFGTAATMADALNKAGDKARWQLVLDNLPDFALDEDGGFAIAPGSPVNSSHRHFSHLLAFYPLGLLDPMADPAAMKILKASLQTLEKFGTQMWMGYSFAWLASLYALAGDGPNAVKALETYEKGFSGRNGFHTNGDMSGRGITAFPGRLFTLEGGNAACAAVQDMLLQSKNMSIRLFPAISLGQTASFTGLRTCSGIDVSAKLVSGVVREVILSGCNQAVLVSGPGMEEVTVHVSTDQPTILRF